MTRIMVLLLPCLIVGCASAPGIYHVEKSTAVNFHVDQVWDEILDWLSTSKLQIENIERESGFVHAKAHFKPLEPNLGKFFSQGWAECYREFMMLPDTDDADVSIFVRELDEERGTRLTINSKFVRLYTYDNPVLLLSNSFERECVATGRLEREIINHVRRLAR